MLYRSGRRCTICCVPDCLEHERELGALSGTVKVVMFDLRPVAWSQPPGLLVVACMHIILQVQVIWSQAGTRWGQAVQVAWVCMYKSCGLRPSESQQLHARDF
jgi:hypothetical protein